MVRESRPHIRVWSAVSLETLAVLGLGEWEVGIAGLAFSSLNRGLYLAGVDESRERVVSIWDWANRKSTTAANDGLIARVATNVRGGVAGLAFHPFDNNLIISYGVDHLTFWSRRQDGFFDREDMHKEVSGVAYTALAFLASGDVVVGDRLGVVSTYSVTHEGEYYRSHSFPAHEKSGGGGVSALLVLPEGTLLTAGATDGRLVAWDIHADFEQIVEAELPAGAGSATCICQQWPDRSDGNIYVGTSRNLILEGSPQRKFTTIVFGHSQRLLALDTHPSDVSFVTAGTDRQVAKWRRTKLIWRLAVLAECLAVAYHPHGGVLAVATADGHLVIVNEASGAHVTTMRVCGSALTAVKYNLGKLLWQTIYFKPQ
jgi:microtubule-associated protein-like 1/2